MKRKEPAHTYNYVMLVDDNELDNFINQKTIEANHFSNKVYLSTGSKSALEFLKNLEIFGTETSNFFPEVIFVDLNMPMIDGFQFIEHFKNILPDKFNATKIVILTSSITPSDKERAQKISKEIIFFNKPLTKERLNQI
jgi:CheY-like chemotaxis protein